jgi:hypothetical protein
MQFIKKKYYFLALKIIRSKKKKHQKNQSEKKNLNLFLNYTLRTLWIFENNLKIQIKLIKKTI